jgi:hypothetical protein
MREYQELLDQLEEKALLLSTSSVRALAQGEMVATALLLVKAANAIRQLQDEAMLKGMARG